MTRMTCSHCDRDFTPKTCPAGVPEFIDADGKVCCDVCYCDVCGYGHPTADEHDLCSAGRDAADPDLVRDIAMDALFGV
jgi:hypothetical protein